MAKYAHPDVLDNGPAYIKANANRCFLISAYTLLDSFATVSAAKLAEAVYASGDFTHGASGNNRNLTAATKSGNATASSAATTLHFAFVDTVNSKVLWVTDETSDQPVTSGNTINFPALVYQSNQPT